MVESGGRGRPGGEFTVFRSGYEHAVDEKGRVIIPAKFRAQLGEKFVITKGMGGCLIVLTENEWRVNFDEKFQAQSLFDANSMKLQRFFCADAIDAVVDNQGRVALSAPLRQYAGIDLQSVVSIVGVSNRIEIWSKARWDAYNEALTEEDLILSAKAIGVGGGSSL
jgi:MraZ protein